MIVPPDQLTSVVKPLWETRLYTFVDTAYLGGRDPAVLARALCDGGSDLIQIRAKDSPVDEVRRLAEIVLQVTRRAGIRMVLNDHWNLAAELGADLAHLGQEDFFDAGHRLASDLRRSPSDPGLGLSTHAPQQAERALAAGPDYIAIGPVFATATKPGKPAVTLDYVRWAAGAVKIPWFAIGGINLQTLDAVLQAGARRVCVVSAILNAENPGAACREFRRRLDSVPLSPPTNG